MQAYLFKSPGGVDKLVKSEVPVPTLSEDEVLIKTKCIGLNYAEVLSRRGQYSWAPKRPYIMGMEAAGEVVEVGSKVNHVKAGDRVMVGAQYGAYAEFMKSKGHLTYPIPEGWDWQQAGAFLVNFITAYVALFKLGRAQAGEKVLVQAAAGGVGTAAVQLAHHQGCLVAGTASQPEKLELIKRLGADLAINYVTEDFEKMIRDQWGSVDVVIEVVGGEVFQKSKVLLAPFGRLVVAGYASIPLKKSQPWTWWPAWRDAPKVNVMQMARASYSIGATHIGYLTDKPETSRLIWDELLAFVQKYNIKPVVGKVFSFDQIPEAHLFMESRRSMGKIIVEVGP